jgi:O-antigen/teichoic acid export membrane protein
MKLSKSSYWVRSGAYSFGSRFSTLLLGFGSFYFLIRYFDKSDFGLWSLFLTITTLVEMSRNGLIQNALIKLLHSAPQGESGKIVAASWIINGVFSALTYGLLLLMAYALGDLMDASSFVTMIAWYGITMLILIPMSEFNYLQQAAFSFQGIFWTSVIRQGLMFASVLLIYVYHIHITPVELVIVHMGCTMAGLIVSYLLSRPYVKYELSIDQQAISKTFRFGRHVMGTNISSLLFKSTDQLALGALLNPVAVATYNAAMRLSNLIEYPATSVAEVVYPKSAARFNEEGEQGGGTLYEKSVGFVLAITVPIVVFVWIFADLIILLIAGENYVESASLLRITILFGLFTPFNRQFGAIMDSSGRPHLNFRVVFVSMLANVATNVTFILLFGLEGAAYGTLLGYLIMYILSQRVIRSHFDVRMSRILGHSVMFYKMILARIMSLRTSRTKVQ